MAEGLGANFFLTSGAWKPALGLPSHPELWVVMTLAGFTFVDLDGFTPVQAWNSCLQPVSLVALMSREGPAWTAHSKAWSYLVTTVVELGGRGSQKSACKVTGEPGSAAVLCLWQVTRASQALTISV